MTDVRFEARVKAAGLWLNAEERPMLEALVLDLDRAAAALRGPRPYAEEPMTVFRPRPA